jgi:hypothetical protein
VKSPLMFSVNEGTSREVCHSGGKKGQSEMKAIRIDETGGPEVWTQQWTEALANAKATPEELH